MDTESQDSRKKPAQEASNSSPSEAPEAEEQAGETENVDSAETLKEEAEQYRDKFLRAAAELENVKRRAEKEKKDLLQFGLERVMTDLLPVLDSFDKALESDNGEQADSEVTGIKLVSKQLKDVLTKHGLEPIEAKGKPFDPNLHQAIQRIESDDVEEDTIKDEFARGYTLNGRLLRASMVSVSVPN